MCHLPCLVEESGRGDLQGAAADRGAAARERPDAHRGLGGVAMQHNDLLRGDLENVAHDLRVGCLSALSLTARAGGDDDLAVRGDTDLTALPSAAARLDIYRDADANNFMPPPAPVAIPTQLFVICEFTALVYSWSVPNSEHAASLPISNLG